MTNPNSLPLTDQQIAERLAATLDLAQTQLGSDVTAQLVALRREALQQGVAKSVLDRKGNAGLQWPAYSGPQWAAMAAMVALCAITLGVGHRWLPAESGAPLLVNRVNAIAPGSEVAPETAVAHEPSVPTVHSSALQTIESMPEAYTEDPQMLADWEMLDAIGEDPDAS